jgi:hypothetical protein
MVDRTEWQAAKFGYSSVAARVRQRSKRQGQRFRKFENAQILQYLNKKNEQISLFLGNILEGFGSNG